MKCDQARRDLPAYSLGLPGKRQAEVETHIARCGACRRELQRLWRVSELIAQSHPPRAPRRDLWPSIRAQLSERRSPAWSGWLIPALRPVAIGVGAAAALWVGLVLSRHDGPQPAQEAPMMADVTLSEDDALLARWGHESQIAIGPTGPELAALTLASYSTPPTPGGGARGE